MLKRLPHFMAIFLLLASAFLLDSCNTEPNKETVIDVPPSGPFTVTTRLRGEPDRLNPYFTAKGFSRYVFRNIVPNLIDFDPITHELKPVLVKALPVVEPITSGEFAGGIAYTMEIHDEAVWTDGSPVLASDYVFTLKMINNPNLTGIVAIYREIMGFIRDVKIDPNNPKKFTVLAGKPYLQGDLAVGSWMYPEYIYDSEGLLKDIPLKDLTDRSKAAELGKNENIIAFAAHIVDQKFSREKGYVSGCGAYTLEEWVPTQKLVLKKKKDWWGDKLVKDYPLLTAHPSELVYKIAPDQNAAIAMLKDDGLDILSSIPPNNFLEMKESGFTKDKYDFFTPLSSSYNYVGINNKNPKLEQKEVRRALAHVCDLDKIMEVAYLGFGAKLASPIPETYKFCDKSLKPIAFDVEKARTLLQSAGWEDTNGNGVVDKMIDGKLVELNLEYLVTPGNTVSNNVALIFREGARKAGVNIEIVTKEVNKLYEARNSGNFELYSARAGTPPVYYDPHQLWHTESAGNHLGFGNAATDALIEELQVTVDKKKQYELYYQFQKTVYEEQPIIFLNVPQERIMIDKKFKGNFVSAISPGYYENYLHY